MPFTPTVGNWERESQPLSFSDVDSRGYHAPVGGMTLMYMQAALVDSADSKLRRAKVCVLTLSSFSESVRAPTTGLDTTQWM